MMRFACAVGLALGLAVASSRAEEEEVPLENVPAKVIDAIKKEFPKAKLESASTDTEDGERYYSVILHAQKHTFEVTVTEAGKVIEIAKEIEFKELPKPVAAAVTKGYPKAKIGEVAELTVPGVKGKTYHIELTTAAGKELEVVYDPDGKLISED